MSEHLWKFCERRGIDLARIDRRIIELHHLGLSDRAIAIVLGYYHGWWLSRHQVRRRLVDLGAKGHAVTA